MRFAPRPGGTPEAARPVLPSASAWDTPGGEVPRSLVLSNAEQGLATGHFLFADLMAKEPEP